MVVAYNFNNDGGVVSDELIVVVAELDNVELMIVVQNCGDDDGVSVPEKLEDTEAYFRKYDGRGGGVKMASDEKLW